jgi:hypothetical protein
MKCNCYELVSLHAIEYEKSNKENCSKPEIEKNFHRFFQFFPVPATGKIIPFRTDSSLC